MHHQLLLAAALLLLICAGGCGKKGALYLPPAAQPSPAPTATP